MKPNWIVDWWKVLALVLFAIVMTGAYWVVHSAVGMIPRDFLIPIGVALLAFFIGVFTGDRLARRPGQLERSREPE